MAWIGMANPLTGEVEPAASCGDQTGYVQQVKASVRDVDRGHGPGWNLYS